MPPNAGNPGSSPFLFINYTDPSKDRTQKDTRHLVTKHATKHGCKTRRKKNDGLELVTSTGEDTAPATPVTGHRRPKIASTALRPRPVSTSSSSPTTPTASETSLILRRGNTPDTEATEDEAREHKVFDHETAKEVPPTFFTLMSCMTTDPFDVLPIKPNHKIWKLLTSWLNAGAQADAAEDGYRLQVAVIRKSWFWPLVNRNKATFNAAVAWIAVSSNDKSNDTTMGASLANAMPALRQSLEETRSANSDQTAESAWYTIILLLSIAVRTKDDTARDAHYWGLAALFASRPDLVTSHTHTTIPFSASFLYTFVASIILVNYDAYRVEASLSYLPYYVLETGPRYTAALNAQGISDGFAPLYEHGVISSFNFSTLEHIIPLQLFFAKARRNDLNVKEAAAFLNAWWCHQLGLNFPKGITTQFEEYIWTATMMYVHIERRSWVAVKDLVTALSKRLLELDMKAFIKSTKIYNECLLWLVLFAGTYIEDEDAKDRHGANAGWLARDVLDLYGDAKDLQHLHSFTPVQRIMRRFLWTDIGENSVQSFWHLKCGAKTPANKQFSNKQFWQPQFAAYQSRRTSSIADSGCWSRTGSTSSASSSSSTESSSLRPFGTITPRDRLLPAPTSHSRIEVDTTRKDSLSSLQLPKLDSPEEDLCQFCRHSIRDCDCRKGKADPSDCPDHLKGSLWAVPPSIFKMFCRAVSQPRDSRMLPTAPHEEGD